MAWKGVGPRACAFTLTSPECGPEARFLVLSELAQSTWSAGRPWQTMLFCIQTGASCIMGLPLGEFLEPEAVSSKMQETQEGVTLHHTGSFSPAFHVTFVHLCCMLLGMGGSPCVRPRCHCWTSSNSVEIWIPFIPSTALHTIASPHQTRYVSLYPMKSFKNVPHWAFLQTEELEPLLFCPFRETSRSFSS